VRKDLEPRTAPSYLLFLGFLGSRLPRLLAAFLPRTRHSPLLGLTALPYSSACTRITYLLLPRAAACQRLAPAPRRTIMHALAVAAACAFTSSRRRLLPHLHASPSLSALPTTYRFAASPSLPACHATAALHYGVFHCSTRLISMSVPHAVNTGLSGLAPSMPLPLASPPTRRARASTTVHWYSGVASNISFAALHHRFLPAFGAYAACPHLSHLANTYLASCTAHDLLCRPFCRARSRLRTGTTSHSRFFAVCAVYRLARAHTLRYYGSTRAPARLSLCVFWVLPPVYRSQSTVTYIQRTLRLRTAGARAYPRHAAHAWIFPAYAQVTFPCHPAACASTLPVWIRPVSLHATHIRPRCRVHLPPRAACLAAVLAGTTLCLFLALAPPLPSLQCCRISAGPSGCLRLYSERTARRTMVQRLLRQRRAALLPFDAAYPSGSARFSSCGYCRYACALPPGTRLFSIPFPACLPHLGAPCRTMHPASATFRTCRTRTSSACARCEGVQGVCALPACSAATLLSCRGGLYPRAADTR